MSVAPFVGGDVEVQPLLPQVLVVNMRLRTYAEMVAAVDALPAEVRIWREAKAWATSEVMIRLMSTMRRSLFLSPVLRNRQVRSFRVFSP